MALPSREAELIRRGRAKNEIETGLEISRYGQRLRQLLDEVVVGEGNQMDPIKVRAVLSCVQDERLKVVLMDVRDIDFEAVCVQLWNTPDGTWDFEIVGNLDDLPFDGGEFLIRDPLLGERRLDFNGDEETVGLMEEGVLVTWQLDYPENGLDWVDSAFRRRFIHMVDDARPIKSAASY